MTMAHSLTVSDIFFGDLDDVTHHDQTVTFHQSKTGQTLALLEGFDAHRLLWCKHNSGGRVGLQFSWGFDGDLFLLDLVSGGLDFKDLAGRAVSTDETDWGVTNLDRVWHLQDLHLGGEASGRRQVTVLDNIGNAEHDITNLRHVVLVQTLDGETNVVTTSGVLDLLVVHFDGLDDTRAMDLGVRWVEVDLVFDIDNTLFNTTSDDITDTRDLVHTRDRHTSWLFTITCWRLDVQFQAVQQSIDFDFGTVNALDSDTLPPWHILLTGGVSGGNDVVTLETSQRQDREVLGSLAVLDGLPAELTEDVTDFIGNFGEALLSVRLLVTSWDHVHLVDTTNQLLDTQQFDELSMLTRLSWDLTLLVVTLGEGR